MHLTSQVAWCYMHVLGLISDHNSLVSVLPTPTAFPCPTFCFSLTSFEKFWQSWTLISCLSQYVAQSRWVRCVMLLPCQICVFG